MTTTQLRFIEEYTIDGNGAAAARRAGYSENTAKQEAYKLLKNEEIKSAIKERLDALSIDADTAIKQVSDIARTRLNDYLEVKEVMRAPKVRKSLVDLIKDIQDEIEFERQYHELAEVDEDDRKSLERQQRSRRNQIIRYQLELERNSGAYREVDGEPVPVEEVSVNLVALAKERELGRIKTLSFNEFGPKVEMYAADANLKTLLEYHGKIKTPGDTTNITIFQLPDNGR